MSQYTTEQMSLYHFRACPFCVMVVNAIKALNLDIELRDTRKHPQHRAELKSATGKTIVPCLRIALDGDDIWLFESRDIIAFSQKEFG